MNISVQKLLAKMEDELHLAKATAKEEVLREKVYSIKILCELFLDEKQIKTESKGMPVSQPKKLAVDGEANGDSIFDF